MMEISDCGCPMDSEFIYHSGKCSRALSKPSRIGISGPHCPEHDKEMEDERDRWYGAAQERQIRINELKQQVKNLEDYMLKGVAFRDELQARLAAAEGQLCKARYIAEFALNEWGKFAEAEFLNEHELAETRDRIKNDRAALSSPAPCRHAERNAALAGVIVEGQKIIDALGAVVTHHTGSPCIPINKNRWEIERMGAGYHAALDALKEG